MTKFRWFAMAFAIALTLAAAPAGASVETECVSWTVEGGVDGPTPRKFNLGRKAVFPETTRSDGAEVQITATRYRDGKSLNRGKLIASRVDAFERLEDALQYQLDGGGGGAVFSQTVKFREDAASVSRWMNGGKKFVVFIFDLMLKNQPPLGIGERLEVKACVTPVDLKSCDYVLAEPVCSRDQLEEMIAVRVDRYPGPLYFAIDSRCQFDPPSLENNFGGVDYRVAGTCAGFSSFNLIPAISAQDGLARIDPQDVDFGFLDLEYLKLQEALLAQAGVE